MNPDKKNDLISEIGRSLQAKYTFEEIDYWLRDYKITHPTGTPTYNSKWTYVKEALKDVDIETIIQLAEDLELSFEKDNLSRFKPLKFPRGWPKNNDCKLFISHLAIHKEKAVSLKNALEPYGISSFVAHEDVIPTLEWQSEIKKALFTMDAMLCVHTKGFSSSHWTQQEIGFAIARGVKIISLRMDEDPQGFVAKNQAILRKGRNAVSIAKEINGILRSDVL